MVQGHCQKDAVRCFFAGNHFGGEKSWPRFRLRFFNPSVLTRHRADALACEGAAQTNAYTRGPEITLNLHLVLIIARRRHISVALW